jgi:serine/threonine protein kinase
VRNLGGYTLTHRLGVGGMGEVWKGRREALGGSAVDVAIKVLSAAKVNDPEARRMFLDEARLSMLLTNSNIVKVFDAAESEDKTCFMVMEWVEGLNLAELTEKTRKVGEKLPDVIIAYIIGEVLKGLAHAHDLRHGTSRLTIVHRDMSPHNVMLSVSGEVKVMDFGIARVASEETSGVHVKGKVRYMPPEQLRGESREPTLDLFAVGAMLHELLDGTKFRSQVVDEARLYGMVLDGQVPAMTRAVDTLPKELDDLRRSLLAAKPEDRTQTARDAFRLLTRWPGYRDARFELDEIVRRFFSEGEPRPALPATSVLEAGPAAPLVREPERTITASSGSPAKVQLSPSELTVTSVFPTEGSDTGITRTRDAGTNTNVTVNRPAKGQDKSKLAILAFGSMGLVGLGIVAVAWFAGEEPEPDSVEVAEPSPAKDVELAIEGPRVDVEPPPPATPTADEPPPEPIEAEDDLEVAEPKLDVGTATKTEPTPAVKKTKVSITLGPGVPWGEVKLGSRSFVLDAFSSKSSSTSFPAGSYTASFRTQVDGPWTKAGRVVIPAGSATITLQKGGSIIVK